MPTSPEWGWSWTIAAYAVSWAVFLGYARYLASRSSAAHAALQREAHAGADVRERDA